jgi:CheY-like chemotaxis protein
MREWRHGGNVATILVIDDEEMVRATLRLALESVGHEVLEAGNGDDGLRLLDANDVDLTITDIIMPDKEGIETIIEIRRRQPEAKIIAISGGSRSQDIDFLRIAERLGALHTLAKPFSPQMLLQLVDSAIAGTRASLSG